MSTDKARKNLNDDAALIRWDLAGDEAGDTEFGCSEFDDRSVQVSGVFDGAVVIVEGTNHEDTAEDPAVYFTLRDSSMIPLAFSDADGKQILEFTHGFRVKTSGGGAACDVHVRVVAKRKRGR